MESVSLDGKLRIYFCKNAIPMVLHLSGMCVGHRDTPVPSDDTTSLQPSPSMQPSSESLRGRIHEIRVLLVWKSTFTHMRASAFMRPCIVWLCS